MNKKLPATTLISIIILFIAVYVSGTVSAQNTFLGEPVNYAPIQLIYNAEPVSGVVDFNNKTNIPTFSKIFRKRAGDIKIRVYKKTQGYSSILDKLRVEFENTKKTNPNSDLTNAGDYLQIADNNITEAKQRLFDLTCPIDLLSVEDAQVFASDYINNVQVILSLLKSASNNMVLASTELAGAKAITSDLVSETFE